MMGVGLISLGQSGIRAGCMEEVTFKQHLKFENVLRLIKTGISG